LTESFGLGFGFGCGPGSVQFEIRSVRSGFTSRLIDVQGVVYPRSGFGSPVDVTVDFLGDLPDGTAGSRSGQLRGGLLRGGQLRDGQLRDGLLKGGLHRGGQLSDDLQRGAHDGGYVDADEGAQVQLQVGDEAEEDLDVGVERQVEIQNEAEGGLDVDIKVDGKRDLGEDLN
jgi:hypothetical protein